MLTEDNKAQIRESYRALMESKSLSPRWGQRQMIAEIANTLGRIPLDGSAPADSPAVCVIEAGTGTGKTIAYALAAIPLALALDKRLVVATATVALQEQFVNKDLPDIKRHSGLDFNYCLAKGRRRYVCLAKLDHVLDGPQGGGVPLPLYPDEMTCPSTVEAMPIYQTMLEALARGQWDGDRDNWSDTIADNVWHGVTTDHSQCSGRRCPHIAQCSFYQARDQLQNADVIVTNHDLVLSDLALGGGAILSAPEDSIYIFDEGHHLPDKALNHFASFCRLHSTRQWLQESHKWLAQAAPDLAKLQELKVPLGRLPGELDEAVQSLDVVQGLIDELFEHGELDINGDERVLRLRLGRVPETLVPVAAALAGNFSKLVTSLARMEAALEGALDDEIAGDKGAIENWHISIGAMLGRAESNLALWQEYGHSGEADNPPKARWLRFDAGANQPSYDLNCSPILAADILQEHLWPRAAGVVITSATLTALSSFERFILRSGVSRQAIFNSVPSPFDYANAVFSVPAMPCEPSDASGHTAAIVAMLPQLLKPDEGSLVLFSSRRQMRDVHAELSGDLRDKILMQDDASKQELLRRHREAVDSGAGSVLFGLASFAEGVDLPGDYCRHVVIAKLPFAVLDNPLEAALAEWVEAQGRNAFMEISVPDAAIKLVQASGRLLRTETDSGRVTLLDRRVVSRRYGRAILDSLPPFRRELA